MGQLMAHLQNVYATSKPCKENVRYQPGQAVVAWCSSDETYYRGVIRALIGDKYKVVNSVFVNVQYYRRFYHEGVYSMSAGHANRKKIMLFHSDD